jgi:PST family polysaccharide transporter
LSRIWVFVSGIVLARLLTEEDFGVVATALVAVNLLMAVNELGVIPAIVRWQGDDVERAARTGSTIAGLMSCVLYLVAFVAAPGFADLLGAPEAAGVLRVLALTVLVDGFIAIPLALLTRSFRQGRMTAAETIGMVTYGVVAVAMAAAGTGAWAIAVSRVVGSVVTGLLFFKFSPARVRPGFERDIALSLLRFGVPIAASALIVEAVLNVDYVVVGRTLGTMTLGLYLFAFNLSSWPVSVVSVAIGRVSFAGFSRLVDDRARLVRGFLAAFGIAALATVGLVLILVVLAPEIVEVIYGDKWLPAVVAVRFLLVLGGFRVLSDLVVEVVIADGRPTQTLVIRIIWLAALAPALVIGANSGGLRGVGIAHLIVALGVALPLFLYAANGSGIKVSGFAHALWRPLSGAAVALIAMLVTLNALEGALARLVVGGMVGMAVYALLVLPWNPLVTWLWHQLRGTPTAADSP